MEYLIASPAIVVDYTEMREEMDLFDWKGEYRSAQEGSPVNKFWTEHKGQRCMLFLDEFEKVSDDVRQALLLVFD